jgi:hypothetical protein
MCATCGIIFEVKEDPKFCSDKCRKHVKESQMGYLKKGMPKSRQSVASGMPTEI